MGDIKEPTYVVIPALAGFEIVWWSDDKFDPGPNEPIIAWRIDLEFGTASPIGPFTSAQEFDESPSFFAPRYSCRLIKDPEGILYSPDDCVWINPDDARTELHARSVRHKQEYEHIKAAKAAKAASASDG